MINRLLVIAMLGVLLNGCFMAPMALLGPITSGYSTASLTVRCFYVSELFGEKKFG